MEVTKIVGKADANGNWVVKPSHHRVGHSKWAQARAQLRGTTLLRLRPREEVERIATSRKYRGSDLQRVAKEALVGKCGVNFGEVIDRSDLGDPRTRVKHRFEFEGDTPTSVDVRTAVWLLNPEKWGKLFEECGPSGAVELDPEPADDDDADGPKKPSGKKRKAADKG